jgi:hypothetical protein
MGKTTDLRDGYNLARQESVQKNRPYEMEMSFADPQEIANSLLQEDGNFPDGLMKTYYDGFSVSGNFQTSCGQVTTYLRDYVLKGNWVTMMDNKRGTFGGYKTKQECYKWIAENVLNNTGYFGVLLGCHSFTLSIFNNKVRIYQGYMAMGFEGYNFTKCIDRNKVFTLIDFKNNLRIVILGAGKNQNQSAATLFYGTCDPNANCANDSLANLCVYQLQAPPPSAKTICDNFKALKKSHEPIWAKAQNMTVKQCAIAPPLKGRGLWTPDSHGICEICQRTVGWGTRHHCRVCGKLICGKSSCMKKMTVKSTNFSIEKVCRNCFNTYT